MGMIRLTKRKISSGRPRRGSPIAASRVEMALGTSIGQRC